MAARLPFNSDEGMGLFLRERARRERALQSGELDPMAYAQAQYAGTPGWDAFWGGLTENDQAAEQAGLRHRATLGDFGNAVSQVETDGNFQRETYMPRTRSRATVGSLAGSGDFDADTMRDVMRQQGFDERVMDARFGSLALEGAQRQAQAEKDALRQAEVERLRGEEDRFALEQAFGPASRDAETEAPSSARPRTREEALSRLPARIRLQLEQQFSGQDVKEAEAQAKLVAADAALKKAGEPPKPTYEWAQTPEGVRMLTPEEIRAQKATKPLTAMEAMDERKYKKAEPVLRGISELSEKINTQQGLLAKMGGGASRVAAKANYDDDVAEYDALVSGFTPMVARALGHTGVLTQQDVDSVKALFPKPGDSKTLRDRKMARVTSIISDLEGATSGPAKPVQSTAAPPSGPPANETPDQRLARLLGGG